MSFIPSKLTHHKFISLLSWKGKKELLKMYN